MTLPWIIAAFFALCTVVFITLAASAPIGEEIEGVGFLTEDELAALNAECPGPLAKQARHLSERGGYGAKAAGGSVHSSVLPICSDGRKQ